MPSIISRMWAEAFAPEAGIGGEPPMRTTVGYLMAALVLASLLSAWGWLATPTHRAGMHVYSALPESRTHHPGG
jgi:hypothetical protein